MGFDINHNILNYIFINAINEHVYLYVVKIN